MTAPPLRGRAVLPWANLAVPGGDGTDLGTDAHVPPPDRWPVPTVITRTPYGRSAHLQEGRSWRARGFGFVVQDVRGRYDSDGTWTPYRNERADGAALVDWVTAQPWSDGTVIAYGGSYAGYTAWTAAVERPAAVRAVVSLGPSMGLHRTKFTPSGILRLAEHAAWWLDRADSRTNRDDLHAIVFAEHPRLLEHLPVAEIGELLGARLPHWADTLGAAPTDVPPESITDAELAHLDAASLHVAGWYDLLVDETLRLWHGAGARRTPRPHRQLLIGPWGHDLGLTGSTMVGAREHGPAARIAFGERCVRWLRAVLEGAAPTSGSEVFVLGTNAWSSGGAWPPPGTEVAWFPHPDRTLRPSPAPVGGIGYAHDPTDAYPSALAGTDRSRLLSRPDAARFRSDPLAAPLRVEGVGRVELTATTTGASADWVVRLLEQHGDGRLLELASGATCADATTTRLEIGMTPVAAVVAAGSRLVLEITSADFPFLARNLGTGADRYRATVTRPALQTVHTGATRVLLPVPAHG